MQNRPKSLHWRYRYHSIRVYSCTSTLYGAYLFYSANEVYCGYPKFSYQKFQFCWKIDQKFEANKMELENEELKCGFFVCVISLRFVPHPLLVMFVLLYLGLLVIPSCIPDDTRTTTIHTFANNQMTTWLFFVYYYYVLCIMNVM